MVLKMNAKSLNARLRILKSSPPASHMGFWAQIWRAFAKRPEVQADARELEKIRREARQEPRDDVPFTEDNELEAETDE